MSKSFKGLLDKAMKKESKDKANYEDVDLAISLVDEILDLTPEKMKERAKKLKNPVKKIKKKKSSRKKSTKTVKKTGRSEKKKIKKTLDISRGLWRLLGNSTSREDHVSELNLKLRNELLNPVKFGIFLTNLGEYLKTI